MLFFPLFLGYLGQTFLIKKNVTACYECSGPKVDQKTFASCTIRNTPSLPIHCIVWGKHLFNQLFGEDDADNDVSPDMNDPELMNSASSDKENLEDKNETNGVSNAAATVTNESNNTNANSGNSVSKLPSTRKWAETNNYDAILLFDKLFRIDIEYLHKMDKLWKNRTKPITLKYDQLDTELPNTSNHNSSPSNQEQQAEDCSLKEQKLLSLKECYELFAASLLKLKERLKTEQYLVWDKDDEPALDFVTAVSNLRSICFHIERKSKFDVKSMAGNIIPAISSTNSIIGGLMVLQLINLFKRLTKLTEEQTMSKKEISELFKSTVKHVFLRRVSTNIGNLIAAYDCFEQNPKCMVCCTKHMPEIEVKLNFKQVTMFEFVEQFIFKKLNFVCPDIQLDGQPTIIWSKDDYEEYSDKEKEEYKTKLLANYKLIKDKVRLKIYDLLQNMSVIVTLFNEEFTLNENDGLFYKMLITSEADEGNDEQDDELDTSSDNSQTAVATSIKLASTESSNLEASPLKERNLEEDLISLNGNNNNEEALNRQETIELESDESNQKIETTNDKLNSDEKINGNHSKIETLIKEEIVIIDSDDEEASEQHDEIKVKLDEEENSICEVLDDDDDLHVIDVTEVKEKRKLIEIDNSDERSSKKLRIEHSDI